MNRKKDVLFLCQYFYPEYVSSATLPFDTALSLTQAGYTVGALSGYPQEYSLNKNVPMSEIHNGIYIKRVKYIQLKRSNFVGRLINYFSFTAAIALRILEIRRYKVIIVYSNPPILPLIAAVSKKLFKTKIVFVSYDVYPEMAEITKTISPNSVISKVMKVVNKVVINNVDKVVALSSEMKSFLIENRPRLTSNNIDVIANWYEDKGLPETYAAPTKGFLKDFVNEKNLVVSYFGNMGVCQDMDTIIEAMKKLKTDDSIKFLFAGHGIKMKDLKEVIKSENLSNVQVYDFLHGTDYEEALTASDCFLVSLAEGLTGLAVPSKTYSYMMAGKPVLAILGENSDIAKELRQYDAGYAMNVGDSNSLVSAIIELRSNQDKREYMGQNSRRLFLEKYTTQKSTEKYVELMRKLLEED